MLVGNSEGEGGQSAGAKHSSRNANQGGRGGSSEGGIAGFVVVELHRLDWTRHYPRCPARLWRRQLGTLLMEAAEERVRKLGGFMMELETAVNNAVALAFYERHRYRILKRLPRYYSRNLDALLLTKRL